MFANKCAGGLHLAPLADLSRGEEGGSPGSDRCPAENAFWVPWGWGGGGRTEVQAICRICVK